MGLILLPLEYAFALAITKPSDEELECLEGTMFDDDIVAIKHIRDLSKEEVLKVLVPLISHKGEQRIYEFYYKLPVEIRSHFERGLQVLYPKYKIEKHIKNENS